MTDSDDEPYMPDDPAYPKESAIKADAIQVENSTGFD
jgi:hypothetical protein